MRIETSRDRAANAVRRNEAVVCARQRERERFLEEQIRIDYLFSAINRHSAEANTVFAADTGPTSVMDKTEMPKSVTKVSDTLRVLIMLVAMSAICIIAFMNALCM